MPASTPSRPRAHGFTILEALVALAIAALVIFLAAFTLKGVVDAMAEAGPVVTLSGKLVPAEAGLRVGENTTLTLMLTKDNMGPTPDSFLPAGDTRVGVTTVPGGSLKIVSLNGQDVGGASKAAANTDANGLLTIVVRADSVPLIGSGALVVVPVGRKTAVAQADFEIFE